MKGKSKFALIHGIINIILPLLVVLAHNGMFGSVEDAWKMIWLAAAMVFLPIISSLAGIIIASIQKSKIGLFLSCVGLMMHIIFRLVVKL